LTNFAAEPDLAFHLARCASDRIVRIAERLCFQGKYLTNLLVL